jgi:hypothetical protein
MSNKTMKNLIRKTLLAVGVVFILTSYGPDVQTIATEKAYKYLV